MSASWILEDPSKIETTYLLAELRFFSELDISIIITPFVQRTWARDALSRDISREIISGYGRLDHFHKRKSSLKSVLIEFSCHVSRRENAVARST